MGVVFTSGGRGWARMVERYQSAQQNIVTNVQEAIPEIVARIRDAADDGPAGIHHIDTGHLNDSIHGENEDSIELLLPTVGGFHITIGTLDRAAVFQARRFGYEGPVVPVDPEMVREVVSEHYLPDLKAGA